MKKITFDKKKDKIAIIAPSSGDNANSENGLRKMKGFIELIGKNGFHCEIYDEGNILSGCDLPYLASSDQYKIEALKKIIETDKYKIIWAFRGGYGASRIVDDLLKLEPAGDKILIGFSDITVLHTLFNQVYKMPSIHGGVINSLLSNQKDMLEPIINVLSGKPQEFKGLKAMNQITEKGEKISAKIVGGNLRVLCNSIGTDTLINADGKILFLEEISELDRRIDSDLVQMKRAKIFSKVKALIFGDFVKCLDLEPTLKNFVNNILPKEVPVFRAEGIGHGEKNYPIVLDGNAEILGEVLTVYSPFELIN